MKLALRHAQHAYREKEVPIGAIVVDSDGNILATGRNQVEECHDATAHAELNALKQAAQYKNNWRLLNCTLYTTVEPCMMCFGAMQAFRISRVVYAAKDIRLGACGSWQSLHNVKHPFHHVVDVSGGVCEEESSMLLRRFFSSLRTEKFRYPGYDVGRGVCDSDIDTSSQG
jgi:tRNA(adenine34) deaminase